MSIVAESMVAEQRCSSHESIETERQEGANKIDPPKMDLAKSHLLIAH